MAVLALIYGATALLTTVLVFLASRRFSDRRRPVSVRLWLSAAAGVV